MGKGWNCRHNLTRAQEALARKIRTEIIDEEKNEIHYAQLKYLFNQYKKNKFVVMDSERFGQYVNECYPSLYSAFKRLDIDLLEAVQK